MKIALGSDEKSNLTDALQAYLEELGHELVLFGPLAGQKLYWPRVAQDVSEAVISGEVEEGILLCWTGTGVSIAANKVPGIRAALCDDSETARGARLWNNANVLCLSLRRTSEVVGKEILDVWFQVSYQPNAEDDACLLEIKELEEKYSPL
jgi:ribose 5-phosphate isomerase B